MKLAHQEDLERIRGLLAELLRLPGETEWVELKVNNSRPEQIGEYISALSNSAALLGKPKGYLVWGVEDGTHTLVGTNFDPSSTKVGEEDLTNWLLRLLSPQVFLGFCQLNLEGHPIVVLEVAAAARQPTRFKGLEFIRVQSYKKKLKDHPEIERELWRLFSEISFEEQTAMENVGGQQVLALLDYPKYFDLLGAPLPDGLERILEALDQDRLIRRSTSGAWDITCLGAILLSKDLGNFPSLRRKAVRVILYKGQNRIETIREQEGAKGYAAGFEGLIGFISALIPSCDDSESVKNEVAGSTESFSKRSCTNSPHPSSWSADTARGPRFSPIAAMPRWRKWTACKLATFTLVSNTSAAPS